MLFRSVDENTYIVTPDQTFDDTLSFTLGGIDFEVKHLGPAHAPGDSIMLVRNYGVLFSGDVIYEGRIPFLDSPETDTANWLRGLDYLTALQPRPRHVIPGHGNASSDIAGAVTATRTYIEYVRDAMQQAVDDFIPFDQAYDNTDWSKYEDMPAFDASNRGNAYRIYLELEAESF